MTAMAAALDNLAQQAPATVDRALRAGADRLIADPWRLGMLLRLRDPFSVLERPISNLRFEVSERMEIMRSLGARSHYAYCGNTMMALRQADLALSDVEHAGGWQRAKWAVRLLPVAAE